MVTILLVTAFGMSACSSKQTKEVSKTTSESSFISHQRSTSQTNSSTKSQTSSSKTTTTDESSSTIQAELKWNSEKKFRLAEFMSAWGKEMNQNYSQYDPTHNVDFYGLSLPFSVLRYSGKPRFGEASYGYIGTEGEEIRKSNFVTPAPYVKLEWLEIHPWSCLFKSAYRSEYSGYGFRKALIFLLKGQIVVSGWPD